MRNLSSRDCLTCKLLRKTGSFLHADLDSRLLILRRSREEVVDDLDDGKLVRIPHQFRERQNLRREVRRQHSFVMEPDRRRNQACLLLRKIFHWKVVQKNFRAHFSVVE